MKKVLALLVCVLMVVVMMAACAAPEKETPPTDTQESSAPPESETASEPESSAPAQESPAAATGKKLKIGFAIKNLDDQFMKNEFEYMQAEAEKIADQFEYEVLDSMSDVSKQIENVESFVARNFDVIICHPVDIDGSSQCVVLANDAGIPYINMCSKTTNQNYQAYIGSNDVEAGEMQAAFINEKLPGPAKIVYMMGPIGESAQVLRLEGTKKDLFDVRTDIEVLDQQTAEWDRNRAMQLVEDWMTRYKNDIDAVVCQNDDMAMGAVIALENMKMKDEVIVIGCDAIKEAVQAVKDGRLDATILFNQPLMAEATMQAAVNLATGKEQAKDTNNPFKMVLPDNIAEFDWILE